MAYSATRMNRVGGMPGYAKYLYSTADLKSTVIASGYFNTAITDYNLTAGDTIDCVCNTGGTCARSDIVVTSVASGTATTAVSVD